DRFARDLVLLGTYGTQAALMAITAVALAVGSDPLVIYALAIASATLVSFSRPVHAALMPEVVVSPDELTAANVVSGMLESAGTLTGPLGAGLLIGAGGPAAVFAAAAFGNLVASVAVISVARRRRRDAASMGVRAVLPLDRPVESGSDHARHLRATAVQLVGGLSAILADERLRADLRRSPDAHPSPRRRRRDEPGVRGPPGTDDGDQRPRCPRSADRHRPRRQSRDLRHRRPVPAGRPGNGWLGDHPRRPARR